MSKHIELNEAELELMRIIFYAEYKILKDRKEHAVSHGDVGYLDTHMKQVTNILTKIG